MPEENEDYGSEKQGPAELRAAFDRVKAERDSMVVKLYDVACGQAGYPEGTVGRKAIDSFYEGDRTDADAIASWAADYGFSSEAAPKPPAETAPTAKMDDKLDQVEAASTPVSPTTTLDDLKQEELSALQRAATPGLRDNAADVEKAISAIVGQTAQKAL